MFGKRIVAVQKNSAEVKMWGNKDGHTSVFVWIDLPGDSWGEVLNMLSNELDLGINVTKREKDDEQ